MDYKALYGLVFAPILIALLYMGYLHYSSSDDNNNTKKFNETMIPLEQNFAQIDLVEFKSELDSGETILIDVRRPEELTEYGVVSDNQINITLGSDNFSEEILKLDKQKKYLVYCWHGQRSTTAREFMQENGFTWVKDLEGGIDTWNAS